MSTDQGAPGSPEQEATPPSSEGETLDISAEDLQPAPAPPVPPAPAEPPTPSMPAPPLPAAPPPGHHDDVEVTLVSEPPGAAPVEPSAPETSAWPAAPVAPPPTPIAPMVEPPAAPVAYAPPAPAVQPPAPVGVAPTPTPVAAVTMGGADQWYTSAAGQTYGPYPAEEIRRWLQSGQVSWDTQAARAGETNWRPLHQILEFNPSPGYGPPIGSALAVGKKDRTVAGILGILLGAFGAHHWYLGNYLQAALYLVFFWTGIPTILGIVEGIMYLTAPEDRFQRKYKQWFMSGPD